MRVFLYFFLIFTSSACASSTSSIPVNVESWESMEINSFNTKIQEAYASSLQWATKPELYVFNLFELSELKKISYEYSADSIEAPKNIDITIIRDGFLDDSVRGEIQHIKLGKNNYGKWEVLYRGRAISCWRSQVLKYSSEACP